MKKLLCAVILAGLAMAPAMAEAYWVDISAGYWNPEPSGGISYNLLGAFNDKADLERDMGFEKEGFAQVRAKVDLPLLNIGVQATPMEFTGRKTLVNNITFGGNTYATSTTVDTKMIMDHYDVALFWALPFLSTASAGTLNVELGLNARMLDFEVTISEGATWTTKAVSPTIPMLYVGAQITPTDSFGIEAEYRGLSMDDNSYTDMMAKVRWNPVPVFYISAGYRSESLEIDEEGVVSDMEFKGPFAELGLRF